MKVCILTEGGKSIGLGHVTRCVSICQAFEEVGIKPQLIVNGDETVEDLLRDKNCKVFDWLNDEKMLFATVKNADIVFIDSYLADYDLYEKISILAGTAVYFDDDIRINYPRSFVVNGAIFAEQMPYPRRKDVTYLLGVKYAPIRKELWDVPTKLIRREVETLMVTFGGSDMCNVTPKVQKVLNKTYPYMQKKIIVTRFFANMSEIKKLRDKDTELIYEPDAIELKEIMLESDIAISAGGQTLYELARVGTPTIGICVAENQLQNIKGWSKSGFLEYIGWYNNKDIQSKLITALEEMKSYNKRFSCSRKTRELIDGKGSRRVCDILLQGTQ